MVRKTERIHEKQTEYTRAHAGLSEEPTGRGREGRWGSLWQPGIYDKTWTEIMSAPRTGMTIDIAR